MEALVNLPIVIPHTAAGVALLLVFGRRGLLGQWLAPLGVTFTDSFAGIVVGMGFVSLPFLVTMSREAFALIDEELERVALIDGASAWQAFRHVTLPQAWRGVLGGALMMWARGISEFGAVVILAYHPKIVPVLVYERFNGFGLGQPNRSLRCSSSSPSVSSSSCGSCSCPNLEPPHPRKGEADELSARNVLKSKVVRNRQGGGQCRSDPAASWR